MQVRFSRSAKEQLLEMNAFESLKQGLTEAVEFSRGDRKGSVVTKIENVNVKSVRKKTGMTQKDFALSFGISLGTLRHWERGDRTPKGPALVLLNLVKKDPHAILKLLTSSSMNRETQL